MRALIIVISIVALGVTATTIVVGGRSFEGLVVDNPYETGLAWDKTEQQKSSLGWKIFLDKTDLRTGTNDLRISVLDRSGSRLPAANVNVRITRQETNVYDRTYSTVRLPDGVYVASVTLPVQGNWQAVIAVSNGNDRTIYTVPLFAEGGFHETGHH